MNRDSNEGISTKENETDRRKLTIIATKMNSRCKICEEDEKWSSTKCRL
ncbi:unnamed protein product [Amoebophrya sp. A120]|nr:unnamed protein product [Amoebophrya sp. A120]|eukprot:GSA120T00026382001.1